MPRPWEAVRLETARLLLRPPLPEDAPAVAELLTDPEVMRFLGGEVVPEQDVGAVVEKWRGRWERNSMGPFLIERREDGRFVGRAGILVWDVRTWTHTTFADAGLHAQPELGWALARAHWGNGYATEAAQAVREWARSEGGVRRLVSVIALDNVKSQGVAWRLGASPVETVSLFDSVVAAVWLHPESSQLS
jgi:RimJ/RimL family protein N-acetyltransferase